MQQSVTNETIMHSAMSRYKSNQRARKRGRACFVFFLLFSLGYCDSGCQHQRNRLPGKTCSRNDPLRVKWDIKLYLLTYK